MKDGQRFLVLSKIPILERNPVFRYKDTLYLNIKKNAPLHKRSESLNSDMRYINVFKKIQICVKIHAPHVKSPICIRHFQKTRLFRRDVTFYVCIHIYFLFFFHYESSAFLMKDVAFDYVHKERYIFLHCAHFPWET